MVFHPSHRPLEIAHAIPTVPQPRRRRFSPTTQGTLLLPCRRGHFYCLLTHDTNGHCKGRTNLVESGELVYLSLSQGRFRAERRLVGRLFWHTGNQGGGLDPDSTLRDGGVPARESRRAILLRNTRLLGLSIVLLFVGVVLFAHNASDPMFFAVYLVSSFALSPTCAEELSNGIVGNAVNSRWGT